MAVAQSIEVHHAVQRENLAADLPEGGISHAQL